jgi:hypothetical protein
VRGRICRLQLLLVLASAIVFGSESHGTHDHILLSHSRLPQPGGPGPRIYIPREQGGPFIPHALGSLFVASYDSQGCDRCIRTRLHTGFLQLNRSAICQNKYSARTTRKTQPLYCCRDVFKAPLHSYLCSADHIENVVLLFVRPGMLLMLPSNGRCLPSHCLATGLYATILMDQSL